MSVTRKVREMEFAEVDLMINYFLDSDTEHFNRLGVDSKKLPSLNEWRELLRNDFESTYEEKETFYVVWVLDNLIVGHSHIAKILYEEEAYMHLHLWSPIHRKEGNGTYFIIESIKYYFDKFKLRNLYCEPHAINPAPNRTLARVGFEFLKTHETTPGWINYHQPVNRWVLTREIFESTK